MLAAMSVLSEKEDLFQVKFYYINFCLTKLSVSTLSLPARASPRTTKAYSGSGSGASESGSR